MDDADIKRLRREIHRTFGSSPHKKRLWLALLEMHTAKEKEEHPRGEKTAGSVAAQRNRVSD